MSVFNRDELLTMLLYGLDMAMRPTMGNLFNGDEYWRNYNTRHRGQLAAMQTEGLIQSLGNRNEDGWALKLTEAGRLRAIGGRDPQIQWGRTWDGEWNMLMFDLEAGAGTLRQRLLRWLRSNNFGCLQQSVWITPDPISADLHSLIGDYEDRADHLLVLQSKIAIGKKQVENPRMIASQAWDFESINDGYAKYLEFIKTTLPKRPTTAGAKTWVRAEHSAWCQAFKRDPLLPETLLPKGYLGRQAWEKRRKILKVAAQMTIALQPEAES